MPVPSAVEHDDTDLPGWVKPLLLLGAGVALSGVADFALTRAGYGDLATLVWVLGYAGTLMVLWLVWGQHLDLVGDTGVGHDADAAKRAHASPGPDDGGEPSGDDRAPSESS